MSKEHDDKKSRRNFLRDLGLLGTGAIAASGALYLGNQYEKKKLGKNIKLLTQDGKTVEFDGHELISLTPNLSELQERGREGIVGRKWVMVIDLSRCRNARKCVDACQGAHQLKPEQFHMNTLQMKDSENGAPYYMPKTCMHCDNPPCVSVCPVDATFKRNDGIVLIDNERCIGCRFCIAACPYSARSFNWFDPRDAEKYADQQYDVELNVPQKKGTITKCLFSADRLRRNEMPYCVTSCPNGVYYFGDEVEDTVTNGTTKETVRFSDLIKNNGGYRLMEELGQKPRVYYLPPRNPLFPIPDNEILPENKNT